MIFKYALRNIKTLEILKQRKFQQLIFWVFSFFILKTSLFITRSAYFPSICIRIRLPKLTRWSIVRKRDIHGISMSVSENVRKITRRDILCLCTTCWLYSLCSISLLFLVCLRCKIKKEMQRHGHDTLCCFHVSHSFPWTRKQYSWLSSSIRTERERGRRFFSSRGTRVERICSMFLRSGPEELPCAKRSLLAFERDRNFTRGL